MLRRTGIALAAAASAWILPWGRRSTAQGQDSGSLPHLSEDDPMAMALMYVNDATTSQSDTRQENAFCHNCRYWQGEEGVQWGPCQIFPSNTVNRDGWCSVWVARE